MQPINLCRFGWSSILIRSLFAAVGVACFGGFSSVCEAVTVNNGNFEIGAFNIFDPNPVNGFWRVDEPPTGSGLNAGFGAAGWQISVAGSITGTDQYGQQGATYTPPHSGHIAAAFTSPPSTLTSLSQAISTTPGGQYALHFWLSNPDAAAANNRFSVFWRGTEVRPASAPPLGTDWILPAGMGWTEYVIPISSTSASTALVFSGYNEAATLLDDVSIVNIPEPDAASTFVIGALGLSMRRRRSRER